MRRSSVVLTVIFLVAVFAAMGQARGERFIADRSSGIYHLESCNGACVVKDEDRLTFEAPEDAVKAGFKPCIMCYPPVKAGLPNPYKIDE